MILDISLFVGFFLVIYISFTLATTYIYKVYAEYNQQSNFVDYKKAFMYFFWALIRTGNPQFVDVKIPVYTNSTLYSDEKIQTTKMDGFCLERVLRNNSNEASLPFHKLAGCFYFDQDTSDHKYMSEHNLSTEVKLVNDDGMFFVVGNVLWASYQFMVVIVLLSILRARMISTYQNINREADVQWKFFR